LRHGLSTAIDHDRYNQLKREYNVTLTVAETYWPFTLFKGRFDDSNMQRLIMMMDEKERELIPCDTKFINWEKYLMETHIPGVMEYESRAAARARLQKNTYSEDTNKHWWKLNYVQGMPQIKIISRGINDYGSR
ncbi:unnamed protein product, partial [Urochloa humidicola]